VRYPEIVNCHAFLVLAELLGGQAARGRNGLPREIVTLFFVQSLRAALPRELAPWSWQRDRDARTQGQFQRVV